MISRIRAAFLGPHRRALKFVHPLHPLEHAGRYYTYGVLLAESEIVRAPASEDHGTGTFSLFDALDRNTLQVSSSVQDVMRHARFDIVHLM